MNKLLKTGLIILNLLALTPCAVFAQVDKIKFDKQTFNLSNPDSKTKSYDYLLKDENAGNCIQKFSLRIFLT